MTKKLSANQRNTESNRYLVMLLSLFSPLKTLIKLNEKCGGAVSIAGIILVDFGSTQRTCVVFAIQPTQ